MIIFNYLITEYTKKIIQLFALSVVVLAVINVFDVLTKFKFAQLSLYNIAKLAIYKIPYLLCEISPIIALLATTTFINYLLKTNQLSNILNSGLSIRIVIKALTIINLIFALISLLLISPLGSVMLRQYELLEKKITQNTINSAHNLLLKESYLDQQRFSYISSINFKNGQMQNIEIFILHDNTFTSRLSCEGVMMKKGMWRLENCTEYGVNKEQKWRYYDLRTKITKANIISYTMQMHNTIFWFLPSLINTSAKLGMQVKQIELYYYKQLLRPVIIILLGLLPFCLFKVDRNKIFYNLIDSIVLGLLVFLCMNISVSFIMRYIPWPWVASILPIAGFSVLILFLWHRSNNYQL